MLSFSVIQCVSMFIYLQSRYISQILQSDLWNDPSEFSIYVRILVHTIISITVTLDFSDFFYMKFRGLLVMESDDAVA